MADLKFRVVLPDGRTLVVVAMNEEFARASAALTLELEDLPHNTTITEVTDEQ